jgi:parallel beta-helix repeat protein
MRPYDSSVRRYALLLGASSAFAVTSLLAPAAQAATSFYASPTGMDYFCTRADPCALSTAAGAAQAGDFVVLLDGTYPNQELTPANSGTASAWITFIADSGAVPILDGSGADPKAVGISSDTVVYVRFIGIVARNWAGGFSNEWIGSTTDFSANGNWQYINCIADGNTRNGFAFNSAKGVTIRECISAHNGTSTTSSWSSGFQLYGVQGTASDNVVERNVSFENMDAQKHTDGSGFIVDTMVTGLAFINNIAFRNGGSGIRLTGSSNIEILNNTLYHNGQDTTDNGPPNPGEIYFTSGGQTQGLTMVNTVGVPSGSTQDPSSGWVFNGGSLTLPSNDVVNASTAIFTAPDGTNPDFHPAAGSTTLVDKGTTSNAPSLDNGFDPKCITKTKPTDIAVPPWTAYGIDYTYIKSVGGVAGCFKPGTRPAGSGIDVGAYEVNSTPAARPTYGPLPPAPTGRIDGGAGPVDDSGTGSSGDGGSVTSGGGSSSAGGGASGTNTGGSAASNGSGTSAGGSGAGGSGVGGGAQGGGSGASGAGESRAAGASNQNGDGGSSQSGCALVRGGRSDGPGVLLLVSALAVLLRRRSGRPRSSETSRSAR